MDARHVDHAAHRLHELKRRGIDEVVLGAAALLLAVLATRLRPDLALPLLAAGLAVAAIGVGALVSQALLVDELAADRDAYLIDAVRLRALRAASPEHRRRAARALRALLDEPGCALADRVAANREELEDLVAALERDELALAPERAVELDRLLEGRDGGALYAADSPAVDLHASLVRILAGFERRQAA